MLYCHENGNKMEIKPKLYEVNKKGAPLYAYHDLIYIAFMKKRFIIIDTRIKRRSEKVIFVQQEKYSRVS